MKNDPTADMLKTTLACHENPQDMRLNPHLKESDVAETIRIAIECLETEKPKKPQGKKSAFKADAYKR